MSSPKTGSFAFYQIKSFIIQLNARNMFKTAFKGICTSAFVVTPEPLSTAPSTSSAMKTPQNTEKGLITLNHQMK